MNLKQEIAKFTNQIIEDCKGGHIKRKGIVPSYAWLISQMGLYGVDEIDFKSINQAIIKRWSVAGLIYIKEQAWKMIEK